MKATERLRFFKALMLLATTFNEPMSEARLEGYFIALEDLDVANLEHAVRSLLRTARFFPRPAEIRESLNGSMEDRAALAWADFLNGSVTDPIGRAAIDGMGGTWEIRNNMRTDRAETTFMALYRALWRKQDETTVESQRALTP